MVTHSQTLLPFAPHVVTTRMGYTIHFPLIDKPIGGKPVIIAAARTELRTMRRRVSLALNEGRPVLDPLSGKKIKVYRRTLHTSQVRALQRFQGRSAMAARGDGWMHLSLSTGRQDGDWGKLAHWELIEALPKELAADIVPADANGRKSPRGWWRITQRGRDWLAGRVRIPRFIALLNGERLDYVDHADLIGPADVLPETDVDGLHATGAEAVNRAG